MNGWILLHRKFLKWEWYDSPNTKLLFIHLLLKANFKDSSWKNTTIKRGQIIIGRRQLARETGLTEQKVRSSLINLQSTHEITIKPTNKYSIVTVCNYDKYQSLENTNPQNNQQNPSQLTNNQPQRNESKELNNKNKRFLTVSDRRNL